MAMAMAMAMRDLGRKAFVLCDFERPKGGEGREHKISGGGR